MTLYEFFFKENPQYAHLYRTVYRWAKKGVLDSVEVRDGKYFVKDSESLKKEIFKISQGRIKFNSEKEVK